MNAAEGIAESMVHAEIEIAVEASKLAALGAKNLMALIVALMMEHEQKERGEPITGAASAVELIKQGKPVTTFKIKESDLSKFKTEANDTGLMYCPLRPRDDQSGLFDVMAKAEDAPVINVILERMGYAEKMVDDAKNHDGPFLSAQGLTAFDNIFTANQRTGRDLTEVLGDTAALVSNPDLFKEYLEIQGRMPTFSERNESLIKEQMPDAEMVMSKSDWRACGRSLRKDAVPIHIKRPGFENGSKSFTDMNVYDISDTVGTGIPKRDRLNRLQLQEVILQLVDNCPCEREKHTPGGPKGYDPETRTFYIDHSHTGEELAHHLIRESAHAYQHKYMGEHYDRDAASVIADCAAVQICASYDMDTSRYNLSAAAEIAKNDPDAGLTIRSRAQDLAWKLQCLERGKYKKLARENMPVMER